MLGFAGFEAQNSVVYQFSAPIQYFQISDGTK